MDSTEVRRGADGNKRQITNMCIQENHDAERGSTQRLCLFVGNEDEELIRDLTKRSIISLLQTASKETICRATVDGDTVEVALLTIMRALPTKNSNKISGEHMGQIMNEIKKMKKQNLEMLEKQRNLETLNKAMQESQDKLENQMYNKQDKTQQILKILKNQLTQTENNQMIDDGSQTEEDKNNKQPKHITGAGSNSITSLHPKSYDVYKITEQHEGKLDKLLNSLQKQEKNILEMD